MEAVSDRPTTVLDDEIIAEGGNEEDERFGYAYYRLRSGWIMQGRADPASVETYKKKGAEVLLQYGRYVFNPAILKDRRGNALPQWMPYFQPYDKLLIEAPEEFPLDQIVAYHWHRGCTADRIEYLPDGRYRRHRQKITFPQLAGRTFPDHLCMVCGRVFNAAPELNKHTRMSHPEQSTILKLAETQEAIATAITAAQTGATGASGDMTAVLQQVMAGQAQLAQILQAVMAGLPGPATGGPKPKRTEAQKEHRRYNEQLKRVAAATAGEGETTDE
jgi:hypothetical protein